MGVPEWTRVLEHTRAFASLMHRPRAALVVCPPCSCSSTTRIGLSWVGTFEPTGGDRGVSERLFPPPPEMPTNRARQFAVFFSKRFRGLADLCRREAAALARDCRRSRTNREQTIYYYVPVLGGQRSLEKSLHSAQNLQKLQYLIPVPREDFDSMFVVHKNWGITHNVTRQPSGFRASEHQQRRGD